MKSKKIVSSDTVETYKVITDFLVTINLLIRIFPKQSSTLAALTHEAWG